MKRSLFVQKKIKQWITSRHSLFFLAMITFLEACCSPISSLLMLTPMILIRPQKKYWYATLAISFSIFGSMIGYFIGRYAFHPIVIPMLKLYGYECPYRKMLLWFNDWGGWSLLLAGFTPLPYKLFTIGAGVIEYRLDIFLLGVIAGRMIRFYFVCLIIEFKRKIFSRR